MNIGGWGNEVYGLGNKVGGWGNGGNKNVGEWSKFMGYELA